MEFKKTIVSLLMSALALMLTACGNEGRNLPKELSDICISAVKAADDYIDHKISYDEASNKISDLSSMASEYYDKHKDDEDKDGTDMIGVNIELNSLSFEIMQEHIGYSTYVDLLTKRNELANSVGLDERE